MVEEAVYQKRQLCVGLRVQSLEFTGAHYGVGGVSLFIRFTPPSTPGQLACLSSEALWGVLSGFLWIRHHGRGESATRSLLCINAAANEEKPPNLVQVE